MDALNLFEDIRLVPVVVIDNPIHAVPLAETLLEAGIICMEITLRSPAALDAISAVANACPDMLVGAGSIIQANQFAQVKNIGARFAVSPGHTSKLIEAANIPYLPGAASASECLSLLESGYNLVKFFPAEIAGGMALLSALNGPIPNLKFCPTGGVNLENAKTYLNMDCVACVGGSWFVPRNTLAEGDFPAILKLAKQAASVCSS